MSTWFSRVPLRPRHGVMIAIGVGLLISAQTCLNYRDIKVHRVAIAENNTVFAAIGASWVGYPTEIHVWSPVLSQHRRLRRSGPFESSYGLISNRDGSMLLVVGAFTLSALDTRTKRVIWRAPSERSPSMSAFAFIDSGRYIVHVKKRSQHQTEFVAKMEIIRARDGKLIGTVDQDPIDRVFWSQQRLRYTTDSRELVTLEIGNTLREINRFSSFNPNELTTFDEVKLAVLGPSLSSLRPRQRFVAYNSHARVDVLPQDHRRAETLRVIDLATAKTLAERPLTLPLRGALALLVLTASGFTALVTWWIHDGANSSFKSRMWIDGTLLMVALLLMSIDLGGIFDSQWVVRPQWHKLLFVAVSVVVNGLLIVPLVTDHSLYLWLTVFIAAVFPLLIPIVALAFLLRTLGIGIYIKGEPLLLRATVDGAQRILSRIRFRFGIQELMLATVAIALMISIGILTVTGIVPGFMLAFLVGMSAAIGISRRAATACGLACIFAAMLFGTGEMILRSGSTLFALALLPLPLLILRCYDVRVGLPLPDQFERRITGSPKPRARMPAAGLPTATRS